MARARAHDRDDKADEDRAAAERLLVVKLAAPVAELADRRRRKRAVGRIREVERPLPRLRVVQTEAEPFEVTSRPVRRQLDEVRLPIPHLPHHRRPVHLDPRIRSRERMQPPLQMRVPRPDLEVEVARPVTNRLRSNERGDDERGKTESDNLHASILTTRHTYAMTTSPSIAMT